MAVMPSYQVFPTALCAACPEQANLLSFELENLTQKLLKVRLSVQVLEYSQPTVKEFELPPGSHSFTLQAVFQSKKIRTLVAPVATQVQYRVCLVQDDTERVLQKQHIQIRLLPANNFLFARYDPAQRTVHDFSWLIAAWVQHTGKRLEKVRQRASELCPLTGYQAPRGENMGQYVRAQVAAIYQALKEQNLAYQNRVLVYHQETQDYVQHVRFPEQSLEDKAVNCLDAAVLFASLLSYCDLDPMILLLPGHALVSWSDGDNNWEFLETTVMAEASFEVACQQGRAEYQKVESLYTEWCRAAPAVITDTKSFAIPVDVHRVWRERKILTL
jgi:hypothetical protein